MKTILLACVLVLLALFGMRTGTAQDQKAPMTFFRYQRRTRQWG